VTVSLLLLWNYPLIPFLAHTVTQSHVQIIREIQTIPILFIKKVVGKIQIRTKLLLQRVLE